MFRHSLDAIIRGIHCIKVMPSIFSDVCSTVLHTSENIEGTTLIQLRLRGDGSQGMPKHMEGVLCSSCVYIPVHVRLVLYVDF